MLSHPCRWIWWQLPLLPQIQSIFHRDPHPWSWNWMATTLTTPTTVCFLKRPHPPSVFILCAWYTIWVSISIKSLVLSLFLAFITLSDLYYPHHPPSEGCTFRRQKKGILYIQGVRPLLVFFTLVLFDNILFFFTKRKGKVKKIYFSIMNKRWKCTSSQSYISGSYTI